MKLILSILGLFLLLCLPVHADPVESITGTLDFTSPSGTQSELFAMAFDWNGSTVSNMSITDSGALGSSFSFLDVLTGQNFFGFQWGDPAGDRIDLSFLLIDAGGPDQHYIIPLILKTATGEAWSPSGEVSLSAYPIFPTAVAATPEPSNLLLFGSGMLGLALLAMRKRPPKQRSLKDLT